jgi:hypothetical protein
VVFSVEGAFTAGEMGASVVLAVADGEGVGMILGVGVAEAILDVAVAGAATRAAVGTRVLPLEVEVESSVIGRMVPDVSAEDTSGVEEVIVAERSDVAAVDVVGSGANSLTVISASLEGTAVSCDARLVVAVSVSGLFLDSGERYNVEPRKICWGS